jgi:hypothetical protein
MRKLILSIQKIRLKYGNEEKVQEHEHKQVVGAAAPEGWMAERSATTTASASDSERGHTNRKSV